MIIKVEENEELSDIIENSLNLILQVPALWTPAFAEMDSWGLGVVSTEVSTAVPGVT